jgi:hypothetical protein
MSRTVPLPWPFFKEVRALTPVWLGCIVAMVVPTLTPMPQLTLVAYFLGAALLGSLSIGHEYVYRTLSLQLALPIRRERLLLVKLVVLGLMLATLALVAYASVFRGSRLSATPGLAASVLPMLIGLFVAPWLTMAFRSPVAGAVLSIGIPTVLVIVGVEIESRLAVGISPWRLAGAVRMGLGLASLLTLCLVGAVAGWRTFMRLEDREALEDVRLTPWPHARSTATSAAGSPTRRHPFRLLVAKELHLHQLAVTMAGLYLIAWLAGSALPAVYGDLRWVLPAVYGPLLGMLIGTVASAEERQLGTVEWQVLQPVAMWKQWAIKAGVALGLAAVLGKGLPAALGFVAPTAAAISFPGQQLSLSVVLLLTAGSLYVSTLCTSAALAFLAAGPAMLVALWFRYVALGSIARAIVPTWWFNAMLPARPSATLPAVDVLDVVFAAGPVALLLWFAMENHRSADRSPWRAARQIAVVAAFEVVRVVVLGGVATWLS